jgi:hypothetical protein
MASNDILIDLSVKGRYTTADGVGAVEDKLYLDRQIEFSTGSGFDQSDAVFEQSINITASGNETLNLSALTDPLGAALNFTRIKAIVVYADPTNVNDIVLGNAGTTPFSGPFSGTALVHVPPGGELAMVNPQAAGWAVGAGINLLVANGGAGTSVTGKLLIIGARE